MNRGVAICHYNRSTYLNDIIRAVKETVPSGTRIVVCDDGSDDWRETNINSVVTIRGPNLGVAANKNRALWALQDCQYLCILEDDLKPVEAGWFETYERASQISGIHHFCRVQDKIVPSQAPRFDAFMVENKLHPMYGPSPRGDLTFITRAVVRTVGAFNPLFRGAGYAHGEWSNRVARAGMINHPNKWVDIQEASARFEQVGDTEGGRWEKDEEDIKRQLTRNKSVLKELQRNEYTHHPLVLE